MEAARIQALRAQGQKLRVAVTVGKSGVTDATLAELDRHLKKDKLVKVRLLPSAVEAGLEAQAAAMAERTRSTLVEVRGSTALFWRA